MPASHEERTPRRSIAELQRLARYQRWLIATLLAEVALWVGFLLLSTAWNRRLMMNFEFPLLITLILGGIGGVYSFLICWTIRGPFSAVVMGVGTMIPCMGLLVLTAVNSIATTELNANGISVGVFGADVDAIGDETRLYDDEDAGW